jgi:hypothetical protein
MCCTHNPSKTHLCIMAHVYLHRVMLFNQY